MAERKRTDLETAKGVLQMKIDHAAEQVAKFELHLDEHGPSVFESCDFVLNAGAAQIIYERVLGALEYEGAGRAKDETPEERVERIYQYAVKEVVKHARSPRSSTSATSNLFHLATGAAWAEVAEVLGGGMY